MAYRVSSLLVNGKSKQKIVRFCHRLMESEIKTDRFEEKIDRFISLFGSNNPFVALDPASHGFPVLVFNRC